MQTSSRPVWRSFGLVALLCTWILSACGGAPAAPTVAPDAIFTSAAQTFQANLATQAARVTPTNTAAPSPSPFPTFSVASPLPGLAFASATPLTGGTSDCDNAAYLADVTIPDGTVMNPGQHFTKTWRMYNSGTCPWSTGYKLVFAGGDSMGPTSIFVPMVVPVAGTIEISVDLKAPDDSGSFKSNWQLQNEKNQGFGSIVYAQIQVGVSGSATCSSPVTSGNITISGTVTGKGADGVTIQYSGTKGGDGSVVTDAAGNYIVTVSVGWAGTITPSKGIHTFDPPSISFPNVNCNLTGQNFAYQ